MIDKINKNTIILISIIIIILILLFYNLHIYNTLVDNFLSGLFIANDEFSKRVELDGMLLYIGLNNDSIKKAYIILHGEGVVLVDKKINIEFLDTIFNKFNLLISDKIYKKIHITDSISETDPDPKLTSEIKEIFPSILNCEIDIPQGKITWTDDDDVVYAEFFKDNISSDKTEL